ncbi:MAG: hypothetical protein WC384_06210 [Prolixibacteraceae bacterium]|jgi:hypothetical protein
MKRTVFFLATFFISFIVSAQGVDFSGNWKLNNSKSKLSDQFSMAPKEIIIVQDGNVLNVERHSSFQDQDFTIKDKFTLDGKECINPGWQDSEKKSTAVVSADKKSVKIATRFPMGDSGEMTIIEVYKMDGENMVIDASASSSYGDRSETMVFDKQ